MGMPYLAFGGLPPQDGLLRAPAVAHRLGARGHPTLQADLVPRGDQPSQLPRALAMVTFPHDLVAPPQHPVKVGVRAEACVKAAHDLGALLESEAQYSFHLPHQRLEAVERGLLAGKQQRTQRFAHGRATRPRQLAACLIFFPLKEPFVLPSARGEAGKPLKSKSTVSRCRPARCTGALASRREIVVRAARSFATFSPVKASRVSHKVDCSAKRLRPHAAAKTSSGLSRRLLWPRLRHPTRMLTRQSMSFSCGSCFTVFILSFTSWRMGAKKSCWRR